MSSLRSHSGEIVGAALLHAKTLVAIKWYVELRGAGGKGGRRQHNLGLETKDDKRKSPKLLNTFNNFL